MSRQVARLATVDEHTVVAIAALIAAAMAGKALVDDEFAKQAIAELTRD